MRRRGRLARPFLGWAAMAAVIGCGGLNSSDSTNSGLTAGAPNGSGSMSAPGAGPRSASATAEVPGTVAGYVFVKTDEAAVGDPVVIRSSDEEVSGYQRATGGTLYLNVAPATGSEASQQEKVALEGNVLQETLDVHPNGVITVSGTVKGPKGEEILKASAPLKVDPSGTTLLNIGNPTVKPEPAGPATQYRAVLDGKPLSDKPVTLIAPAKGSDEPEDRYLSILGLDEKSRAGAALTITPPTSPTVAVTKLGEGLFRLHAKSASKEPVSLEFKVSSGKEALKSLNLSAKISTAAHLEFQGRKPSIAVGMSGGGSTDLVLLVTDASGRPIPNKAVTFTAPDLTDNRWSSAEGDGVFAGGASDTPNVVSTNDDGKATITVRAAKSTDGLLMGSVRKLLVRATVEGGGRAKITVDIARR